MDGIRIELDVWGKAVPCQWDGILLRCASGPVPKTAWVRVAAKQDRLADAERVAQELRAAGWMRAQSKNDG